MKKTHKIILICVAAIILVIAVWALVSHFVGNRMKEAEEGVQFFNEQLAALDNGYYNSDKNYCMYYANSNGFLKYHTQRGEITSVDSNQAFDDFSDPADLHDHIISLISLSDCYYLIQKQENSFLHTNVETMTDLRFYEFDIMKRENNEEVLLYENLRLVTSNEGAALIICIEDQSFVLASGDFFDFDWKQELSQ